MINKFRSGLVVDNLLRKNKFNPDDENHMIMFLQKHGHTGKELLASDLKNLGVAKDKIPGLLERAASYLSTYTSLQALKTSGSLSKDRLFYKMNEHKVSPDELQVLLDVDKSFTVSGNMITRAFVDEYKSDYPPNHVNCALNQYISAYGRVNTKNSNLEFLLEIQRHIRTSSNS
ncbi:hypothetical protein PsorP6_005695 [Peronosclerospora sorghi]|uniref:Uncharacterized protein n=1 Tax=Peronosclerospora sorghi TaxID=230839 RepID=A0ACC0W6U6_9STRA|nr:hypothetical protein PsorP6_005695 [Peronosclerospora sorghi]